MLHNTRKTNPCVKAKVAIGRCLSYIRRGDQSTPSNSKDMGQMVYNYKRVVKGRGCMTRKGLG